MSVKDLFFLLSQLKAVCEPTCLTGITLGRVAPSLLCSGFLTGCGNPGNHLAPLLVPMYNVLVCASEGCQALWKSARNASLNRLPCLVLSKRTAEVWQQEQLLFSSGKTFHLPVKEEQGFCSFSWDNLFYGVEFLHPCRTLQDRSAYPY